MRDVLTMKEAAEYLRCNYVVLSQKAKAGEVPCFKFGSKVMFRKAALQEWIGKQEVR